MKFHIEIDAKNGNTSSALYFTGARAVDAEASVGKFDFIDKVWLMYANQSAEEQRSYMVYKALSDEHVDPAWQPVIEQGAARG
jgi:hypothetical protein